MVRVSGGTGTWPLGTTKPVGGWPELPSRHAALTPWDGLAGGFVGLVLLVVAVDYALVDFVPDSTGLGVRGVLAATEPSPKPWDCFHHSCGWACGASPAEHGQGGERVEPELVMRVRCVDVVVAEASPQFDDLLVPARITCREVKGSSHLRDGFVGCHRGAREDAHQTSRDERVITGCHSIPQNFLVAGHYALGHDSPGERCDGSPRAGG